MPLQRASVQELQFELLRRARVDGLDGQRVHEDLMARRAWWSSVLAWSFPRSERDGAGRLVRAEGSLAQLTGLCEGEWRCGELYILAVSDEAARDLASLALTWGARKVKVSDVEDDRLEGARVVEVRWDDPR